MKCRLKRHGINEVEDDQQDHHGIHDQIYPHIVFVFLIEFLQLSKHNRFIDFIFFKGN